MISLSSALSSGRIVVFLQILVLTKLVAFGQKSEVERITKTLCSPEFHGRGYVNKGDSIAAEFIAAEFKKIGLKPLKKSYFQSFNLSVNTFPNEMTLQHNGRTLLPGVHYLVDPASAGGKVELRPKLISIETALNVEQLIEEIKSISNGKEYNAIALDFRKLSADTLKKVAGLTEELAGILPVFEIMDRKFTWSVADKQLKNPLIQIQDSIFSARSNFSISIDTRMLNNYSSRNVLAYLPAKKKTKKTVIYSAHYDHLGRMGAETYFPGANDNASGTAMLLSMANYFKEHPVDYNILFIAFAGEEAGLLGSKYFVEHPLIKLKTIAFLLNLDIMGSGEDGITVVNATLFDQEFKELQAINTEKNLLKQVKSRGPAANSDHYWFTQMGVPAFFIYTMGPNKNYHDIFDTQANLSFVEYDDITTLLVEFTKRLKR
ncbi:MAG: M28 family peptidase [Crocinitomicaceae bacterium]|nr:M28 family peptidase [Crocinitomicaceae bacterium]